MKRSIRNNSKKILEIYQILSSDIDKYIEHMVYNETMIINDSTISIVMTTCKRIKQTLFTLDTIKNSSNKNIQVIIVDDSGTQFIDDAEYQPYDFRIDYIKIKPMNKSWTNPCVNYNIGFNFVKGTFVIIQNAEVCHIGDIISFVAKNCKENAYLVFDVADTGSFENNNEIYSLFENNNMNYSTISMLLQNKHYCWYQHSMERPENFHFLTAIHANDLHKLQNGFDIDFALGNWYDDNELIYRIHNLLKLNVINVDSTKNQIMGIHQHHDKIKLNITNREYKRNIRINKYIFGKKKKYFGKFNRWIYLYNSQDYANDYSLLFDN
jgi:hypothetical protein